VAIIGSGVFNTSKLIHRLDAIASIPAILTIRSYHFGQFHGSSLGHRATGLFTRFAISHSEGDSLWLSRQTDAHAPEQAIGAQYQPTLSDVSQAARHDEHRYCQASHYGAAPDLVSGSFLHYSRDDYRAD
jgi:hypothetical protein